MNKDREVKIIRYPDEIVLRAVSRRNVEMADEVIKGLTNLILTAHYHSDFFCAIVYHKNGEIIGYANFIRSSSDCAKWFYCDLWVSPEHRRQGCATRIVNTAREYLSEMDAKTLLCAVEPHNEASHKLHKVLGFEQIATQPFEDFEVDGLIMYKTNIHMHFNIVPLTDDFNHMMFICDLLTQPANVETLHLKKIPKTEYKQFYQDMKAALLYKAAEDESSYMVRKGVVPVAWLKLSALPEGSLWIRMLIVHEKYRNLGTGSFALQFVEEICLTTKCRRVKAHVTSDNANALLLYQRSGYEIICEEEQRNEDDTRSVRYTLQKEISKLF